MVIYVTTFSLIGRRTKISSSFVLRLSSANAGGTPARRHYVAGVLQPPTHAIPARPRQMIRRGKRQTGALEDRAQPREELIAQLARGHSDHASVLQGADQRVVVGAEKAQRLGP